MGSKDKPPLKGRDRDLYSADGDTAVVPRDKAKAPAPAAIPNLEAFRGGPFESLFKGIDRELMASREAEAEAEGPALMIQLLEEEAAECDAPERAAEIQCDIAELYETQLGSPDRGMEWFVKALECDPGSRVRPVEGIRRCLTSAEAVPPIFSYVRSIYQGLGLWGELLDLLDMETKLAALDPKARRGPREVLVDGAQIALRHVGRPVRALELYSKAMAHDPGLTEEVLAIFRRIQSEHLGGQHGPAVADYLRECYEKRGLWEELISLLSNLLPFASDEVRHDLLCDLASIYLDRLDKGASAAECLRRALAMDLEQKDRALALLERASETEPDNLATLTMLMEQYASLHRWPKVVSLLERTQGQAKTPEEQAEHLFRMGQVYEFRLNQMGEALKRYGLAMQARPKDLRFLLAARRAHEKDGHYERAVDLLAREVNLRREHAPDPVKAAQDAYDLYIRMADTLWTRLGQGSQAMTYLQEAMNLRPEDGRTIVLASRILAPDRDWRGVILERERQVAAAGDDSKTGDFYYLVALVLSSDNTRSTVAAEILKRCIKRDLAPARAMELLERILRKARRFDELATFYESSISKIADPDTKRTYLRRLATVCQEQIHDRPRALAAYRALLTMDPQDGRAFDAARSFMESAKLWNDLAWLLDLKGKKTPYPEERLTLLCEASRLYRERLNQPDLAAERYRQVLALDGNCWEALDFFRQRLAAAEAWEEWADLLERAAEAADNKSSRVERTTELARIVEVHLHDLDRAISLWWRVLETEADNLQAKEELRRLLPEVQRWQDLVVFLEWELDRTGTASQRAEVLMELAQVHWHRRRDLRRAIDMYHQVLEVLPTAIPALEALADLYEETQRYDEMAESLRALAGYASREGAVPILHRLASVLDARLERHQEALEAYAAVLDRVPADREAWDGVEDILVKQSRWTELLGLLKRKVEAFEEPREKAQILSRSAEITLKGINDRAGAIGLWERALHLLGTDEGIIDILEEQYESAGAYESLVELLLRRARSTPDKEQRVALLLRRAQIALDRLGDSQRAKDAYTIVLGEWPSHTGALQALRRIHSQRQEWSELVDVLERLGAVVEDQGELTEMVRERAVVLEQHLSDPAEALEAWQWLMDREPEDREVLHNIRRLSIAVSDWHRAIDAMERETALITAPDEAADLLFQMARMWELKVVLPERAILNYRRVLDHDLGHRGSLLALRKIYADLERWPELAEVLRGLRDTAQDQDERVEVLHGLAAILSSRLGQPDDAFASLREAFDLAPTHPDTLPALEEAVERGEGEWEVLVEAYEALALLSGSTDDRVEWLRRRAVAEEEGMAAYEQAMATLKRAFDMQPEEGPVLAEMERLAEATGLFDPYTQSLETLIDRALTLPEQVALVLRLSRVMEERLADIRGALSQARRALGIDPHNQDAPALLNRLAERGGLFEELIQAYEFLASEGDEARWLLAASRVAEERLAAPDRALEMAVRAFDREQREGEGLYQAERLASLTGRWDQLLACLERLIGLTEGDEARGALALRRAIILEEQVGDDTLAFQEARRAMGLAPRLAEPREEAQRIARKAGLWEHLEEMYRFLASQAESPLEQISWLRQASATLEVDLVNLPRAMATMREAFDVLPSEGESYADLRRLAERTGDWEALLEAEEVLVQAAAVPAAASTVMRRRASLMEERLKDPSRALAELRRALGVEPEEASHLDECERLAERYILWEEFITCLETIRELAPDLEEEARWYRREALVLETKVGDLPGALERSWLAFKALPDRGEAFQEVERLSLAANRTKPLLDALDMLAQASEDEGEKAELIVRRAEVHEGRGRDLKAAFQEYLRAFDLAPDDPLILDQLRRLAGETGNYDALLKIHASRWKRAQANEDRVTILLDVAEVDERRGEVNQALEQYLAALRLAPEQTSIYDHAERLAVACSNEPGAGQGEFRGWQRVIDVLDRILRDTADTAQKVVVLRRIWRIQEEELDDAKSALRRCEEALKLDPDQQDVADALERLAGLSGLWERPVALYGEFVRRSAENKALGTVYAVRTARILEDALDQPERAMRAYEKVLQIDPAEPTARERLQELYSDQGKWVDLVRLMRRELEEATDEAARREGYLKVGNILENQCNDPRASVEAYMRAMPEGGDDRAIWESLVRVTGRAAMWQPHVEALDRLLALTADPEEGKSYRLQAAQVTEERIKDQDQALLRYAQVLDHDPVNAGAFDSVRRMYRLRRDWERLAEALIQWLEAVEGAETERRREVLLELSSLLENQLGDLEAAFARYEEALAIRPGDLEVVEAMDRVLRRAGREGEVPEMIIAHVGRSVEERALSLRLGAAAALERQGQGERALELYREVAEDLPPCAQAWEGVCRVQARLGDWEAYCTARLRLTDLLKNPMERTESLLEVAKARHDKLRDYGGAKELLSQVLGADPRHGEAKDLLMAYAEEADDHDQLLELVQGEERRARSAREKGQILAQQGQILERMAELDRAMVAYESSLELLKDYPPAVRSLSRLYEAKGQWAKLESLLKRVVSRFGGRGPQGPEEWSQDEMVALCLLHGRAARETRQGDLARRSLERALAVDGQSIEAWMAMAELQVERGAADQAREAYRQVLELGEDIMADQVVAQVCSRLAALEEEGNMAEAIRLLQQALDATPEARDILAERVRLHRKAGDLAEAAKGLSLLIEGAQEAQRPPLMAELAAVLAAQGREDEALVQLDLALAGGRDLPPHTWRAALPLLVRASRWDLAEQALGQLLQDPQGSPEELAELYMSAGEVALSGTGDREAAATRYRRALELVPAHGGACRALSRLLEEEQRWQELAEMHRLSIERLPQAERQARAAHHTGLGRVLRDHIQDHDGAKQAFRDALLLDDSLEVRQELVDLMMASEAERERAVAELHSLILRHPHHLPAHQRLQSYYSTSGREIEAACMEAFLELTTGLDKDLSTMNWQPAMGKLDDRGHRDLAHPLARNSLYELFGRIHAAILPIFATDPKREGLGEEDRLDGKGDRVGTVLTEACRILGYDRAPAVYVSGQEERLIVRPIPTVQPALVASARLAELTDAEMASSLAWALELLRPSYLLPWCAGAREVDTLLAALAALVRPTEADATVDRSLVRRLARSLPPSTHKELERSLARWKREQAQVSTQGWLDTVEHTALRAALLVSGHLAAPMARLRSAEVALDQAIKGLDIEAALNLSARAGELVRYATSLDHFRLMRRLLR